MRAFDLLMPEKKIANSRPVRGHSAIAQSGPESLVHRRVDPYRRCHFDLTRLKRASLPEGSAGA
jgi:hypothetical protein